MGCRHSRKKAKFQGITIESMLLNKYKHVNIAFDKSSQFPVLVRPNQVKICKWKRGEAIGQGTYSQVFLCKNLETNDIFAAKHYVISSDYFDAYKQYCMIQNEINILINLDHPNIVKYYQIDLCAKTRSVDIFLEYIPGKSLKSLLEERIVLPEDKIRRYAYQILKALCYLHNSGVVHGDLKSANILIDENDTVKIIDFGISFHYKNSQDTPPRELNGSAYWMAPEVANRYGINLTSDVWSFGCVLIEMITGRPPWSNVATRREEVMNMIKTPKLLPEFPKCSDMLNEVIAYSLQRKRSLRPEPCKLIECKFFSEERICSNQSILYSSNVV